MPDFEWSGPFKNGTKWWPFCFCLLFEWSGCVTKSEPFERLFSWKRILIEGSSKYKNDIKIKSPKALSLNIITCSHSTHVSFIENGTTEGSAGIIEHMSPMYLKTYFPLYNKTKGNKLIKLHNYQISKKTICQPLYKIFKKLKIIHIQLFFLNINGAELVTLHSINFDKIIFDVICIENNSKFHSKGYNLHITKYLANHQYILYLTTSNTNWYIHKTFQPSSK